MNIRILLFLFFLTLLITDNVNARRSGGHSRNSSSGGHSSSGSRSGSSSSSSHSSGHGSSPGSHATGSSSTGYESSSHSSSRGSYSSSSRSGSISSSSHSSEHGSSSGSHDTGSSSTGYKSSSSGHTTGSTDGYGSSSGRHMTGSSSTRYGSSSGEYTTGSNPFEYGSASGRHTTGSNPFEHGSSSGQTSHQQNKDASTTFLNAEGGGATRPSQTNFAQFDRSNEINEILFGKSGRPPSIDEILAQTRLPQYDNREFDLNFPIPILRWNHNRGTTENKHHNHGTYNQSASLDLLESYNPSYSPSAPSTNHFTKFTVVPSQSHAPTSFGQPSAHYNPSQGTTPGNPSWSNPHFNPDQSHRPGPTSTNIDSKDHLRPSTSMPVPSPRLPYPTSGSNPHPPSYPTSGSNLHPPSYSGHSFGHSNQPHSTYNPSYNPVPSHTIGHPSSYPSHIPPPVPGTFGNPYSTHPVGGTYGAAGHSYYPQQHVLAQPAGQPYIPGQTVIMVPGQQDIGRGFGQMVKEALVFSTINAGVNRLINPHQHYVSDYGSPARSSASSYSESHITYNNHYYNTAPVGNVSPASSNAPQGNVPVAYPANPGSVNNPVITPGPGESIPTIVNNDNATYPLGGSSVVAMGTANNESAPPVVPLNGFLAGNAINNQGATIYSPSYKISDNDLMMLTEELFMKQEVNIFKYLALHLQSKSENVTDAAKGPLIYVEEEAYEYPTILAIRELYDNYEHNSTVKETRTPEKRKKEDLLLDVFLNTNVMARAMRWLSDRGFMNPDDFERKDTLRHIWFNTFDGATSGFERVFTSERYGTELLGVQDWIYFNYQESKNRINYMGYIDTMKLGDRASLVKLNFQMNDVIRPNATIFVGTLPELEMSLYTICFYARPNDLCPVSFGGSKFNIFTHSFRYYGKDLIDLALPIF